MTGSIIEDGQFFEPCDGTVSYAEVVCPSWGGGTHRSAVATCSCGDEVGSHLLQNQSELYYWCDRLISFDQAVHAMQDVVLCHRTGTSYSAYMGFRVDGEDMDEAEYQIVKARMGQ